MVSARETAPRILAAPAVHGGSVGLSRGIRERDFFTFEVNQAFEVIFCDVQFLTNGRSGNSSPVSK